LIRQRTEEKKSHFLKEATDRVRGVVKPGGEKGGGSQKKVEGKKTVEGEGELPPESSEGRRSLLSREDRQKSEKRGGGRGKK